MRMRHHGGAEENSERHGEDEIELICISSFPSFPSVKNAFAFSLRSLRPPVELHFLNPCD